MTTSPLPPSVLRTAAGWLVGLFAVWQLVFPVLANVLEFVPIRPTAGDQNPPPESTQRWGRFTSNDTLQSSVEGVGYGVSWYAQLNGQEHGWDMFTPGFPPYTVVPFAELDTADGRTVRVHSRFDPVEYRQPRMRLPFRHNREFNCEANLFMLAWHFDPKLPADHPRQPDLPKKVRENEELLTRWLKYQQRRHGDATEVRLVLRYLPMAKPGAAGDAGEPAEVPFARWQPGVIPAQGKLAVEAFDPRAKRFVTLDGWDEP